MITYINESNIEAYTELFSDAETALGTGQIRDLPTYMSKLNNLARISPKYLQLPVDEDVFEIDANKRSISVPKAFSSYGISVKGDEIAEIVYFKIPRYFDIADLSEKKIVIEWENAAGVQGLTAAFNKYVTTEDDRLGDGYLIFGWPIDSRITRAAGTVKFAVRFYTLATDVDGAKYVDYSLSTLAASAKINSTLDIEVLVDGQEVQAEDLTSFVLNRLVPASDAFDAPVLSTNLNPTADLSGSPLKVELKVVTPAPAEDISLTYQWYKDGAKVASAGGKIVADEDDIYAATLVADSIGKYYVVLTNTKEFVDSQDAAGNKLAYHTESRSIKSAECVVPGADAIEIKEDLAASALIEEVNIGTEEEPNLVEAATLVLKLAKPNGVLSAVAQYTDDLAGEWKNVQANQLARAMDVVEGEDEVVITLMPKIAHLYRISLVNTKNGDATEMIYSQVARVTKPAAVPVVTLKYNNEAIIGTTVEVGGTLSAEVNSGLISDELAYQWYEATVAEGDEEAISGAKSASFVPADVGEFYCKVINKLNGNESEPGVSSHITVIRRR